jgi:hypothetical protein
MSVFHSQPDMYDFLLDVCGASGEVANHAGLTPLVLAGQLGRLDMFRHITARRRRTFYSFGRVRGAGGGCCLRGLRVGVCCVGFVSVFVGSGGGEVERKMDWCGDVGVSGCRVMIRGMHLSLRLLMEGSWAGVCLYPALCRMHVCMHQPSQLRPSVQQACGIAVHKGRVKC